MHYVYMVLCRDNTYYTGWTTDLEKRMKAHNGLIGGGAKYTAPRRPVELVYFETYETKSEALQREAEIKGFSHEKKASLVRTKTFL